MDKAHHKEAINLLRDSRYREALDVLDRLDRTPDTLNDRAVAMHQSGDTEEALELLDATLDMEPGHIPAMLNRRYMGYALDSAYKPPQHRVIEDRGEPKVSDPDVSVIIPTYDRPDYLEETVTSVLSQTYKKFELIVVNDGGPDKAAEILNKIGSDRIRYIKIEHGGISAALNAGVAHSRGQYIAYLDDDDIYYPDHLETLAGYLDDRPEAQFAYTLSWRCVQRQGANGWETVEKKLANNRPYDREKLKSMNLIQTTGSVMHRRELAEAVGGFNEKIIGSQDWEWYLRVSERFPLHFIGRATLEHRIREQPGAQLSADRRVMRRNNITVRYMHRLLTLTSDVPGSGGYPRALKALEEMFGKWPDLLDVLDVNELARRKPYACLFRMGKDLSLMNEKDKARAAFYKAFQIAPWEIRIYWKLIFP